MEWNLKSMARKNTKDIQTDGDWTIYFWAPMGHWWSEERNYVILVHGTKSMCLNIFPTLSKSKVKLWLNP
jgi:hypothetical protein